MGSAGVSGCVGGVEDGRGVGEDDTAGMRPYGSWLLDISMILQARARFCMSEPGHTPNARCFLAFVRSLTNRENSGVLAAPHGTEQHG